MFLPLSYKSRPPTLPLITRKGSVKSKDFPQHQHRFHIFLHPPGSFPSLQLLFHPCLCNTLLFTGRGGSGDQIRKDDEGVELLMDARI